MGPETEKKMITLRAAFNRRCTVIGKKYKYQIYVTAKCFLRIYATTKKPGNSNSMSNTLLHISHIKLFKSK